MGARTESEEAVLDAIVAAIVDAVDPSRIILFGSRARGEQNASSDFDVVVEAAGARDDVSARVGRALNDGIGGAFDIVVRGPGEIERSQNDVGCVDYDVVREGILLYVAGIGRTHQHLRPVLRMREGVGAPPPSVRTWLERAEADVRAMESALNADVVAWDAVGFYARQAAEKNLKALLIQRNIRPPRTRDLMELLVAVRSAGYALGDVEGDCEFLDAPATGVGSLGALSRPERDGAAVWRAVSASRRLVAAARLFLRA